jgi:nitrate reductase NapE component
MQNDVTMTAKINTETTKELSTFDVFRIVCLWILFVVGIIGNLLVVILVIWKRHRKQVRLFLCPREKNVQQS